MDLARAEFAFAADQNISHMCAVCSENDSRAQGDWKPALKTVLSRDTQRQKQNKWRRRNGQTIYWRKVKLLKLHGIQ